jgi:hypothetical protein
MATREQKAATPPSQYPASGAYSNTHQHSGPAQKVAASTHTHHDMARVLCATLPQGGRGPRSPQIADLELQAQDVVVLPRKHQHVVGLDIVMDGGEATACTVSECVHMLQASQHGGQNVQKHLGIGDGRWRHKRWHSRSNARDKCGGCRAAISYTQSQPIYPLGSAPWGGVGCLRPFHTIKVPLTLYARLPCPTESR